MNSVFSTCLLLLQDLGVPLTLTGLPPALGLVPPVLEPPLWGGSQARPLPLLSSVPCSAPPLYLSGFRPLTERRCRVSWGPRVSGSGGCGICRERGESTGCATSALAAEAWESLCGVIGLSLLSLCRRTSTVLTACPHMSFSIHGKKKMPLLHLPLRLPPRRPLRIGRAGACSGQAKSKEDLAAPLWLKTQNIWNCPSPVMFPLA